MYNLYYGKIQKTSEDYPYTFFNADKGRLLIFSENSPKGNFCIIPQEYYSLLSDNEKIWFTKAKAEINRRYINKYKKDYLCFLENFIDNVENELKKVKKQ